MQSCKLLIHFNLVYALVEKVKKKLATQAQVASNVSNAFFSRKLNKDESFVFL